MPKDDSDPSAPGTSVAPDHKLQQLKTKLWNCGRSIQEVRDKGKAASSDSSHAFLFKGMYKTLDKQYEKFETLIDEIADMYNSLGKFNEFPSQKEKEICNSVKAYYYESHAFYEKINAPALPSVLDRTVNISANESRTSNRLPKIDVPKFDGDLSKWPKFRDIFTSVIHNDDSLSVMDKFVFLMQSIIGPAAETIGNYALEEQNYPLAWKALHDTYNNKRMLAASYLNKVINFTPFSNKPSVDSLKQFLSNVADSIAAYKLLGVTNSSEYILFFLAMRCLDPITKELFEIENKNKEFPTFEDLQKFVRSRCTIMQLTSNSISHSKPSTSSATKTVPKPKTSLHSTAVQDSSSNQMKSSVSCFVCKNSKHGILNCPQYLDASVTNRLAYLKGWAGCRNCLSYKHRTNNCKSNWHCRHCKKRHHTSLHIPTDTVAEPASSGTSSNPVPTCFCSSTYQEKVSVLLGTALVQIKNARGEFVTVRCVVDSGSQFSFLTQRCLVKLGLVAAKYPKRISGIGNTIFEGAQGKISCLLRPNHKVSPNFMIEAIVVKNITSYLPNFAIDPSIRHRYMNYDLADPTFWQPAPVDLLIGADVFGDIWNGSCIAIDKNLPRLFPSAFGHIIMGKIGDGEESNLQGASLFSIANEEDLNRCLSRFWEIEEVDMKFSADNPDDAICEEHFKSTHYRDQTGRFVVRLPFKSGSSPLGDSSTQAIKRFYSLEHKLKKNPELKEQYSLFMDDYIALDHMSPTTSISKYIVPHHCISKEDRGNVKLRVVFDFSACTSAGSLNEKLFIGPKLHKDIKDILLSLRLHNVVLIGDIVKMYRQISINPEDRSYQHIYWRKDLSDSLQKFELKTLTYGLSSAPFIALRCIKQLTMDEGNDFPLAAAALSQDMYVDDVVSGGPTVEYVSQLRDQIISLLGRGKFQLDKWASNNPDITLGVSASSKDEPVLLSDKDSPILKILGVQWDPVEDVFSFQVKIKEFVATKRGILSVVARIFDPLGFVSPVVLLMKTFLQELWKLKLDWDQQIPDSMLSSWTKVIRELEFLSQVKIPRFVCSTSTFTYQVVGFCDASTTAYSAVLYLRTVRESTFNVHLLISKTRLAPLKSLSVPRLELCGALLLSKLYQSCTGFFQRISAPQQDPVFFTDSMITLGWINTPLYKQKTYVANRTSEITSLTSPTFWKHVPSEENPSDCASRGLTPIQLLDHPLWWTGPSWLRKHDAFWPSSALKLPTNLPELHREMKPCLASAKNQDVLIDWFSRFSSWMKLLRSIAWLLRKIHNIKNKANPRTGALKLEEINKAKETAIKRVQQHYIGTPSLKSKAWKALEPLDPFVDSLGIIRVGGRLRNAPSIPSFQKHPIILPYESHFAALLIDFYHKLYLHPGPNLLQALLQIRYWIPGMRRLIRKRVFHCITCYKAKSAPVIPKMGDLPEYRLKEGGAFLHTGVDFAGPFVIRESLRRKSTTSKAYLCLFVCLVTKALHLEVVSSLSTESFLNTLDRFIARRGLPEQLYSDRGTNFIGAANQLRDLYTWFEQSSTQDQIAVYTNRREIKWNFNPPYAPHFGGIWEAGVKSAKTHMMKVAGNHQLTFEELTTLFANIEAVLNSRPLCPLSNSPAENHYLSPGHFLIGRPLLSVPGPTLLDVQESRLSRWQLVKRQSELFWNHWRLHYLSTLQNRKKWTSQQDNLKKDQLVLLKNPSQSYLNWPLARIVETHPGKDGTVRVCTIQLGNSTYKRSVSSLIPLLPLSKSSDPEIAD